MGGRPGRAGLNVFSKEGAGQPDGKSSLGKIRAGANARIDRLGSEVAVCRSIDQDKDGPGCEQIGTESLKRGKSAFHGSGPKRQQDLLRRVERPRMKRPTARNQFDRIIYIMLNRMFMHVLRSPLSRTYTLHRQDKWQTSDARELDMNPSHCCAHIEADSRTCLPEPFPSRGAAVLALPNLACCRQPRQARTGLQPSRDGASCCARSAGDCCSRRRHAGPGLDRLAVLLSGTEELSEHCANRAARERRSWLSKSSVHLAAQSQRLQDRLSTERARQYCQDRDRRGVGVRSYGDKPVAGRCSAIQRSRNPFNDAACRVLACWRSEGPGFGRGFRRPGLCLAGVDPLPPTSPPQVNESAYAC